MVKARHKENSGFARLDFDQLMLSGRDDLAKYYYPQLYSSAFSRRIKGRRSREEEEALRKLQLEFFRKGGVSSSLPRPSPPSLPPLPRPSPSQTNLPEKKSQEPRQFIPSKEELKAVIERLRHVPVLPRGVTVPPLKATTAEPLPPSFESKHYEPDVLLSDLLGRPPPTHSLDKGALMMKTVKELQGISKSLNISTTRRAKKVMVEKIIAARKKQISKGSSIRRMSHRRKRELAENEIESGNSSRLLKNFMKL